MGSHFGKDPKRRAPTIHDMSNAHIYIAPRVPELRHPSGTDLYHERKDPTTGKGKPIGLNLKCNLCPGGGICSGHGTVRDTPLFP